MPATLREIISIITVLIVVVITTFAVFSLLPSDPIRSNLGINASEEAVEALRKEFGYDLSPMQRLKMHIGRLAQLDLGRSLATQKPVLPELAQAAKYTVQYVALALILSAGLSGLLTTIGYMSRDVIQRGIHVFCKVLTAFPALVVGLLAGIAIMTTDILYAIDVDSTRRIWLIALALSVYPTCSLVDIALSEARIVREATFSLAVRSFGFNKRGVYRAAVLPHILTPWFAQLSNIAAALLSGSIVLEILFSLPGLGSLLLRSVLRNDYPTMQSLVLLGVTVFLLLDYITLRLLSRRRGMSIKDAD